MTPTLHSKLLGSLASAFVPRRHERRYGTWWLYSALLLQSSLGGGSVRRETERIQAELAERELEEARQMLEAAKKKGGAKGLKIKDGAPLNKQARTHSMHVLRT